MGARGQGQKPAKARKGSPRKADARRAAPRRQAASPPPARPPPPPPARPDAAVPARQHQLEEVVAALRTPLPEPEATDRELPPPTPHLLPARDPPQTQPLPHPPPFALP